MLAGLLAQDTVEIVNRCEIAKECFYKKVKNWHPCESMLKNNSEIYDIPKAKGAPKDKIPFCLEANMYLPKENIKQYLNYGA